MDALLITEKGVPVAEHVTFTGDWEQPTLSPDDLLVRTEASALNHLDLWVGRGLPGLDRPFPLISGSDGCGIVEAVGEQVDPQWIGQRVVLYALQSHEKHPIPFDRTQLPTISMIGEHTTGTHAQYFSAPAHQVLAVGDCDPVQAAAYGLAHLTAWSLLQQSGIQMGQDILITGIGGGVALAALNLCLYWGCRVIVTSRSEDKCERALALGAHEAILDQGQDFSRSVRDATQKRGVDICVDSIGQATHLFCIKSLAHGGVYATCGCTTGPSATTDLARIFWNRLKIIGSTMGSMEELKAVFSLFTAGHLLPVIDEVFPCTKGAQAFARLESGHQMGKVVIDWR